MNPLSQEDSVREHDKPAEPGIEESRMDPGRYHIELWEGDLKRPLYPVEFFKSPLLASAFTHRKTTLIRRADRSPVELPDWNHDSQRLACALPIESASPFLFKGGGGLGVSQRRFGTIWPDKLAAWEDYWLRVRTQIQLRHPNITPPDWQSTWWWADPIGKGLELLLVTMPPGGRPLPGRSYHLVAPDGFRQIISSPSHSPSPWGATEPECNSFFWMAVIEGRYLLCVDGPDAKKDGTGTRSSSKTKPLKSWNEFMPLG